MRLYICNMHAGGFNFFFNVIITIYHSKVALAVGYLSIVSDLNCLWPAENILADGNLKRHVPVEHHVEWRRKKCCYYSFIQFLINFSFLFSHMGM